MTEWVPLFKSDYSYTEPANIFKYVRDAVVNKHESFDFFIGSGRGAGKSTCAISLAMMLDPKFSIDRVTFDTDTYADLMTAGLPHGSVVLLDDAGTSLAGSNRKWQKSGAHELADLLQTNRTDGVISIVTSLDIARMELRLRSGFKVFVQPGRKERDETGMSISAEFRVREIDIFSGREIFKLWRYAPAGRTKIITLWHPPKAEWNAYQNARQAFLDIIKAQRLEQKTAAPNASAYSSKDWAREIGTTVARTGVHRLVIKNLDNTPYPELSAAVQDAYDVDRTGAVKIIKQFKDSGIVKHAGNQAAQIFNLTPKGTAFVNKEPIP